MTIITLAQEIYKAFEEKTRDNGDKFYCLKNGSPAWMTDDVIHPVHEEKLPDDTVYEFIHDTVSMLGDMDEDATEDDITDRIYEMEADVYTSDLTAWLNRRNDHVYYLTEVLEEYEDFKDGFQLLSLAQLKQKQEIAFAVVAGIKKHMESLEDEED